MEQLGMFDPRPRSQPTDRDGGASAARVLPLRKALPRWRPPTIARCAATRCEATTAKKGRRCLLEAVPVTGSPRGFCANHARRAKLRDEVLALFCADGVEVWDVARRVGRTEAVVEELLEEALTVKAAIRRAVDEWRGT